jgi:hypothetical protein
MNTCTLKYQNIQKTYLVIRNINSEGDSFILISNISLLIKA